MTRHIAALLLSALVAAHPAHAAHAVGLCPAVEALLNAARGNFAGDPPAVPVAPAGAAAALCGLSLTLSGARSYQCGWPFAFREPLATDTFAAFVRELDGCFGPEAATGDDQAVNHPDSYELRRYVLPDAEIAVSLKDKSALGKTYVFLRVSAVR